MELTITVIAVTATAATSALGPGSFGLLMLYILLALVVSFLCSVMEAVILSVNPGYIGAFKKKNAKVGARLDRFREDVDRPLAAILSFNTVAHTIGAAGAGAEAALVFGSAWMGVFGAVLTLLILIFSEIVPKTIGATYWRSLAPLVTWLCVPMIWMTTPLVWVSQFFRWMIARNHKEDATSHEEIQALAEIGRKGGIFKEGEATILKSLMDLRSLRVCDIMTPRIVMHAISESQTVGQVMGANPDDLEIFSRIPVYNANDDDVTGYLLTKDLLWAAAKDEDSKPISELKRKIAVLTERLPLPAAYDRLLASREHIALVVGEYGGTAGIVTMEDLLETILGCEIVDEADSVDDMQLQARQLWEKRAKNMHLLTEK